MEIEKRLFGVQELRVESSEGGPSKIVGHAAMFNTLSSDLGGFRERIDPGAFADTIASDDIRALINHDSNLVLGRNTAKTLNLVEDVRGLSIEIDVPDTSFARDLVVSIERGDVSQMSFAFSVTREEDESFDFIGDDVIRTLHKVRLFDVSPVTYPAYPDTNVGVRSVALWMENRDKEQHKQVRKVRRQPRPASTY